MCGTCGLHNWYYQKDPFPPDWKQLLIARHLRSVVAKYGLKLVEKRKPLGDERFSGIPLALFEQATRTIHGMQVLPSVGTAAEVLKSAEKVAVTWCDCAWFMGSPDGSYGKETTKIERCLSLDYMADTEINAGRAKEISFGEAVGIVEKWRGLGARQAVGWILGKPNFRPAAWICNCTEVCGQYRTPEVTWAMLPSYVVVSLRREECSNCGECEKWCPFGQGLTFDKKEGYPVIDPAACKGCGLCVDNCPTGALRFRMRRFGRDPRNGGTFEYSEFLTEEDVDKLNK